MLDLLITGATVHDGDGSPARRADVGVEGGRIATVEPTLEGASAAEVVEADGLVLCPGFVDLHAHTALAPFDDPRLPRRSARASRPR